MSVEVQQHPSKREEQLLDSLREVLEMNNYQWDGQKSFKGGVPPSTTHTLKELLVSRSVEVEATSDASVTALVTLNLEPSEEIESFRKLVKFCEECTSSSKAEVAQVIYPLFVHIYIHFFSHEHQDHALKLKDQFSKMFDSTQQSELSEIFSPSTREELLSNVLVTKFRNKKYCMKMSSKAFHLLIQFLQILPTPFLLILIQRYLTIEVYGTTPVIIENKQEPPKKVTTFKKPRLAKLDENRLLVKERHYSSSGFILASGSSSISTPSVPASVHAARSSEFREQLAAADQAVEPTAPSVSVYHVHEMDNTSVHCAAISATSMHYACGFADSSIHIWSQLPSNNCSSHMIRSQPIRLPSSDHHVLRGHSGPIYGTSFNASGEYLLSASEDSTVRLWNLHKHVCAVNYQGHAYPVWDVVFSPVDIHFASASMDQTARLWTTDLMFPLRIFSGHTSSVNVVQFHPNGQYVATGSCDQTCRLWDIQSGQCVRLMAGNKSSVTSLAFSPSGKHLVSGGADGAVKIWDLGGGGLLKEYPSPLPPPLLRSSNKNAVSALSFSPDANILATGSGSDHIRIHNTRRFNSSSNNSNTEDMLLSLNVTPKTNSILQLHFTHQNCLVAIAKSEDSFTME